MLSVSCQRISGGVSLRHAFGACGHFVIDGFDLQSERKIAGILFELFE
jgi:hypothetical protein